MNDLISRIDESMLITWKLLSFFSLEGAEQEKLIGECDNYFIDETQSNLGANYLFGVLLIANDNAVNSLLDEMYPDTGLVHKFQNMINILIYSKKECSVNIKSINTCEEWIEIRSISKELLRKLELSPVSLKKPFEIENYIEVDAYWK